MSSAALKAALSLALFSLLFRLRASWVPVAFYLWVNVYGLNLLSAFWVYTSGVSHPREAKRTFGTTGMGGILAGPVGGLAATAPASRWARPELPIAATLPTAP